MNAAIKYYLGIIILLVLTINCNEEEHTTEVPAPIVIRPHGDTIYSGNRDTTILVNHGKAVIIGRITDNKNPPEFTLPAWTGQTVTAFIKPLNKGGIIRFTKIRRPDGFYDGPFGDSLKYGIKSNGNIVFIIGDTTVKDKEKYTGDFIMLVLVK